MLIYPPTPVWNRLNNPAFGLMNTLSDSIASVSNDSIGVLPDLRKGQTILIGSDYGGQHQGVNYQSLSYLFADVEQCGDWLYHREEVRRRYLKDGRRFSYKALNDNQRKRALFPFLQAANSIPGLSVTLLIDRRIRSLFQEDSTDERQQFQSWQSASVEKLLCVLHFAGLFVAGLSTPNQDILWITDQDEIAANPQRLEQMVNVFATIASHYLSHDLRHLRIATTASDTGIRDIEDFVALPDLVAGCLTEILSSYSSYAYLDSSIILPPKQNVSAKATAIANWFSDSSQPLKRLVYVIDENEASRKFRVTNVRFWGTRDR